MESTRPISILLLGLTCVIFLIHSDLCFSQKKNTFKSFKAVIIAGTNNRVKLRISTGTNSTVATVLTNNYWVWVIDQKGDWYCVSGLRYGKDAQYKFWVEKNYVNNVENLLTRKPVLKDRAFLVFGGYSSLDIGRFSPNDSFEILKQDYSTVTLNIGGKARRYLKSVLAADIKNVKWDIANNIPVLAYTDNQAFFKYYHPSLRFLFSLPIYFLVIPVLCLVFAFIAFDKKKAITLSIVATVFLLFGSCQDSINKKYRSDFYRQVIELKIQNAFDSNNYKKYFEAELPQGKFTYKITNFFTIFVFIVFHIAFIYFLYISAGYIYYSITSPKRKKKEEVLKPTIEGTVMAQNNILGSGDIKKEFEKIGSALMAASKGQHSPLSVAELDNIKSQFQKQFVFMSKRQTEKLRLAIEHINRLIEYEVAKTRPETVRQEIMLDFARRCVEYKRLEVEMKRLELEEIEIGQEMPKAITGGEKTIAEQEYDLVQERDKGIKFWREKGYSDDSDQVERIKNYYDNLIGKLYL